MENQSVGKNVLYQRKLKGYTQATLSEKSEVAIRTIQRIEKNEVTPQLQTIKLLANALEIKVDDLLLLENPKEEIVQKKWLLFLHGSPFLGFIFPFSVLFPLFIWLHKKEDNVIYNKHGIKVINFQLSIAILYVLAAIALITVEKWGFLFFITVLPFNFLVIIFNVFRVVTSQKCIYPLAIPFLRQKKKRSNIRKTMSFILIVFILFSSCTVHQEKSKYEQLLDYEGTYEYIQNTSLQLKASEIDTTLYAVIDHAKYPLRYISLDSFVDMQGSAVVFKRNERQEITGYTSEGLSFNLINTRIQKIDMYPRKAFFKNPDNYQYQTPTEVNDGLKTGTIYEEFKNPKPIINMVKETIKGEFPEVHSILIYKNNKVVLEEYFYGYDKDTPHQLRSATKSFIGSVVGIAVDKGFIKSEKDRILPYFASRYPEIANLDDQKKALTVENFLMYRHGLDCEDSNSESKGNEMAMMQSDNWVKFTLDLPMISAPGKSSSYCTGCALTLGSLVEIATQNTIESFAKKHLFQPLGISNYEWTFEPNKASMTNFSQLKLTPRDLIKLAKVYQDDGKWLGKQVISEDWVHKTFNMNEADYGYLWYEKHFTIDGKKYRSYQASGNGGQKINIWPELDMITVFTGGNYNSYLLYGKSTPPNRMIPNYILKATK
ncbi:DUF4870 domain-containing protein [uncultured Dokdonia sp.]|uniref:DUF4870 domain-containing protein n=1 Tax=uncultured Dokdonia sp. TaxID=575653 RepID=UPI002617CF99|nr:DUF4870 domain-containing protein [uncultured Dokdonia sp.]